MKRWWLIGVVLLAGGCLQVKDQLTIAPDGSGAVRLEMRANLPAELAQQLSMSARMGNRTTGTYPPTDESEAKAWFPAKDFTVKITQEDHGEQGQRLLIEAAFKDVNALLASPYGKAHALSLKTENGRLTLRAVSALATVARMAEMKGGEETGLAAMPGFDEAQKKKGEMRMEFAVALPNAVAAGTGLKSGNTATWVVERAKAKDDDEFARQLGAMLEAGCAADGVTFKPVNPPRLGLQPFQDLLAGPVGDKVATPDLQKIAAAVKFVPYAVRVTRSVDLSGEGGGEASRAQLIGAVVLPPEFAPMRWGEVSLQEVSDNQGHSLLSEREDEQVRAMRMGRRWSAEVREDNEGDEDAPKPVEKELRHLVTLDFPAPDWKVKEIGRIKAAVTLQYGGGLQVIKLANAIAARTIKDAGGGGVRFSSEDGRQKQLSDPKLAELGMSVLVPYAVVQNGMTMLMLQVKGDKAVLADVQVFDGDGQPWPTIYQPAGMGGGDTCGVMMPGKPATPLSLGLLVNEVGASVEAPILLEQVPIGAK